MYPVATPIIPISSNAVHLAMHIMVITFLHNNSLRLSLYNFGPVNLYVQGIYTPNPLHNLFIHWPVTVQIKTYNAAKLIANLTDWFR